VTDSYDDDDAVLDAVRTNVSNIAQRKMYHDWIIANSIVNPDTWHQHYQTLRAEFEGLERDFFAAQQEQGKTDLEISYLLGTILEQAENRFQWWNYQSDTNIAKTTSSEENIFRTTAYQVGYHIAYIAYDTESNLQRSVIVDSFKNTLWHSTEYGFTKDKADAIVDCTKRQSLGKLFKALANDPNWLDIQQEYGSDAIVAVSKHTILNHEKYPVHVLNVTELNTQKNIFAQWLANNRDIQTYDKGLSFANLRNDVVFEMSFTKTLQDLRNTNGSTTSYGG
jgi:hypothetical protein